MSILFTAVSNEHTLVEYFLWENATEILNISISGILFVMSRERIYFFLELKWSCSRLMWIWKMLHGDACKFQTKPVGRSLSWSQPL